MLDVQRRLSARILKCGTNRIKFDTESLEEIKEAITKNDLRSLINNGIISKKATKSTSRFWARERKSQKSHGKQKGYGSRKGRKTARNHPKTAWMNRVRLQREFLKSLRNSKTISSTNYHELYMKSKGGFFRSLRHMKLYVAEKGISKNDTQKHL